MVTLVVWLLLQVPPGTVLVKVVDAPAHTDEEPDIADGVVFTVMALVTAAQPLV